MIRSTDCTVTWRAVASVKVTGIAGAVSGTVSAAAEALATEVAGGAGGAELVAGDPQPTARKRQSGKRRRR